MKFRQALESVKKDGSRENINRQADALLAEMTLKEKLMLTSSKGKLRFYLPPVIGGLFHKSYFYFPFRSNGCKRLGIPEIVFTDGPRGVVCGESTCFPVAAMRAATFDDELEEQVAETMAKEAVAVGANFFAGICLNIVRNPSWGRAQESFGEDPYLTGRKGEIYTRVMQKHGVIACPKHFALNSVENLRFHIDVDVDDRTLREVYLPHFQRCVDAGAMSIMSAYNQLRGQYCGENRELLTDILRGEMGFEGFVMTDFIYGIYDAKKSYASGLDLEMPMHLVRNRKTVKQFEKGEIPVEQLDGAVRNILRGMLTVLPKRDASFGEARTGEHVALAQKVAEEGTVLLKNNGVLPVGKGARLAVVGPFADKVNTGDEGSSFVHCPGGVSAYAGIRELFPDATVSQGLDVNAALAAARDAETVLVVVGSDKYREGECLNNHIEELEKDLSRLQGGDRRSLHLLPEEIALIKAMHDAGKKVIVSMMSGSVFMTEDIEPYTDALILSFYNGVRGGTALARIVAGEVNPSGKLPFTIARAEEDYPEFRQVGERPYRLTYGYYHGYTLFDKENREVSYPFGFGLSYTSFALENARRCRKEDAIEVSADLTNTGEVTGAEVVQVYAGSDNRETDRPVKLLRGYRRVSLAPGETRHITLSVPLKELEFYDPETRTWSSDESYTVYLGTSSRDCMALPEQAE